MLPDEKESPHYAFLITAAGSGRRVGGEKKEFRKINGRTVLSLTVEAFLDAPGFSFGLVTCKPGTADQVKEALADISEKAAKLQIPLMLCDGGADRQESVYLGLKYFAENAAGFPESGIILIHDGARPWVTPQLITSVAEGAYKHNACAPVVPSIDAMKEINNSGIITAHHPREETVSVQTPQGFVLSEILSAHHRAAADGRHYIDDTEIFSRYEGDVYTVKGSPENKKLTYLTDFTEAE